MSLIEGVGISVQFGKNRDRAVSAATFEIAFGQITLFLGHSGSGKTTLLRVMGGLIVPTEGELVCTPGQRIGYVSQSSDLFPHMRVLANCSHPQQVVLGRTATEANQKAQTLLESLGVADLASRFPHELSGGQRQKVAIVRALAMETNILLLDEPTASLDPASVASLGELLLGLQKQKVTLVVTTHDMNFARALRGRIYIMEQGRILANPENSRQRQSYLTL